MDRLYFNLKGDKMKKTIAQLRREMQNIARGYLGDKFEFVVRDENDEYISVPVRITQMQLSAMMQEAYFAGVKDGLKNNILPDILP